MGNRAETSGQSDVRKLLNSILTLSGGILVFNTYEETSDIKYVSRTKMFKRECCCGDIWAPKEDPRLGMHQLSLV